MSILLSSVPMQTPPRYSGCTVPVVTKFVDLGNALPLRACFKSAELNVVERYYPLLDYVYEGSTLAQDAFHALAEIIRASSAPWTPCGS